MATNLQVVDVAPSAWRAPPRAHRNPQQGVFPSFSKVGNTLKGAALLYVGGFAETFENAAKLAKLSLNSGSALRSLQRFRAEAKREVKAAEEAAAAQRQREQDDQDAKDSVDRRRDSFFYAPEPERSVGVGTSD